MSIHQTENGFDLLSIHSAGDSARLFRDEDFSVSGTLNDFDIQYDELTNDWEEDFYNVFVDE